MACGQQNTISDKTISDTSSNRTTVIDPTLQVPATRDIVPDTPVAQFSERTDNPLNEWYFSVKLFETKQTFDYIIKMQFEEIRGEDTLKLPNFGKLPQPLIHKGPEKYSCIIGFLDKDNQFREYKKIYVQGDHLKITALR